MRNVTLLIKPASSLCNMRCEYCFYDDVSKHRKISSHGIMSIDVLDVLTRRAFAFAEESVTFVFQGGEPMLAGLDFFKAAMELQRKYKPHRLMVYNSIQTNGILINDEWADFFRDNDFLVGVSLDGTEKLHNSHRHLKNGDGSYSSVLAGIDKLTSHGVSFNILCVVSAEAARMPREIWRSLRVYGHLQFIPLIDEFDSIVTDHSLGDDAYGYFLNELFDEYRTDILRGKYVSVRDFDSYINALRGIAPASCSMRGRCGGYFAIEADGSVYPCDFYITDEYRLGNITDSSFFSLAKSDVLKRFVSESAVDTVECQSCRYFPICRGGCRRYREPQHSISKFCGAYKSFFGKNLDKMLEIARNINTISAKNSGGAK